MNIGSGLEQSLAFINCQMNPASAVMAAPSKRWRAVTISRLTGSGAQEIAERLAAELQARSADGLPWNVVGRELIEKALDEHHLSRRLARFMPEDRITGVDDAVDEILGLHPPYSILIEKISETILQLAKAGNVILIGRGANVVTSQLNSVFHVRIVASLEKRAEAIQKTQGLSRDAAVAQIQNEDRGRGRYMKKYFQKDIDDPLLYHLVINTDIISCEQATGMIADVVVRSAGVPPASGRIES